MSHYFGLDVSLKEVSVCVSTSSGRAVRSMDMADHTMPSTHSGRRTPP